MKSNTSIFLLQSAALPLALGALLFLSAGTFDWLEAWLYLLVFFVAVMWIGYWLLKNDPTLVERRQKMGSTGETSQTQKVIVAIAGTLYFGSFVVILLPNMER